MKFQKKVLDNGLTVLFEKRDVDVTTVMLGVRYGSGYDLIEEKGMAHFIEHLCFKGTKKRSSRDIVFEIESLGGDVNAFTSKEATVYLAKLPSKYLNVAMNVIFDVFFNPVFPKDEIEREASVICEEIKMYRDNPMRHTLEKIEENLYEEPFGYSGTDRAEVVLGMTRESLLKKHNEVYIPENSIVCVVGNNNFEEVVALAQSLSPKCEVQNIKQKMPEIVFRNIKDKEKRNNLEQSNVALGFHFPKGIDNMRYSAEIFSAILGKGMSSKLFSEVREKRGLVYGVKTDFDFGANYGYMIIWAGTDPSKVAEVEKICLEEFRKMKDLTEKELDRAKVQIIGGRKIESEGSSESAVGLIMEEIIGDAKEYYNYEKNINRVSLDDIKELANKVNFSSFSLGP